MRGYPQRSDVPPGGEIGQAQAALNNIERQLQAKTSELNALDARMNPLITERRRLEEQRSRLQPQIERLDAEAEALSASAEEKREAANTARAGLAEAILLLQRVLNEHLRPLREAAESAYQRAQGLTQQP